MSEAIKVPMVCVDCGGTMTDDDAIWSPGIGVLTHINYSQCIASLNERLTALTQRAEAAEARRDVWELRARKVVQERRTLRVERDALRTRLDEWVRWGDRMASGHPDAPMASLDHEVRAVIANRYGMSVVTAALAVQP